MTETTRTVGRLQFFDTVTLVACHRATISLNSPPSLFFFFACGYALRDYVPRDFCADKSAAVADQVKRTPPPRFFFPHFFLCSDPVPLVFSTSSRTILYLRGFPPKIFFSGGSFPPCLPAKKQWSAQRVGTTTIGEATGGQDGF